MNKKYNFTEEERRAHKNKINNEYYHRNKERINFERRGGPKRVVLTEEEKKQKQKAYNDLIRAEMKKQPHKVYLLEDYNYVGVTNCLFFRFNNHKHQFNRDCTNHTILLKTKNRDEALELESKYHDMGYAGKHKQNSYR